MATSQDGCGRIVVIGAGAGGLLAAARAAELAAPAGIETLLLEKTDGPGKKILISGKTRCNLSNTKPLDAFLEMYGPNGRFLRSAFNRFFREQLLQLLAEHGVSTKAERGGRIFPASDDAHDVVAALLSHAQQCGARLITGVRVTDISTAGGRVQGVHTQQGFLPAAAVVIATGGSSYPGTGSSGDGYRMAAALGHSIVKLRPALVPLVVRQQSLAASMQGTPLRNVRLTAFQGSSAEINPALAPSHDTGRGNGKRARPPVIESRMGEMMFTHFGIGGPITLLLSLAVVDALDRGPVSVSIDLKPALSDAQLRQRLQRELEAHPKRGFHRLLEELLPHQLVQPFVELSGIPATKLGHQIVAEERNRLAGLLKSLRFDIERPLPLATAIVTAGGVSLKEIDPRTMASRLVRGLYFCGEVMDLDADTGGYNLQAAFSTGYVAGESAAQYLLAGSV